MATESEISDYFQNRQSKGWYHPLKWASFIHIYQYINKPYYLIRLAMTESRNSRWRSSKPEVPIIQLVEELATRFQIIIPCFRGRAIQWRHSQHCPHHTGSRSSRWRSSKPEVSIFQHVEELAKRFQIIIPCFRGFGQFSGAIPC